MHTCVVFVSNVSKCKNAVSGKVESLKHSEYDLLPELAEWALNHAHKLVELDYAVSVKIERFEKPVDVLRVDVDTEVVDGFCELVLIKRS